MRHGVLVVDKPREMTSAGVVALVRRRLGGRRAGKVGHTGTLDPLATGVLPLVLGDATKLASHLLADDKAYEAELELGACTDTHDATGAITARAPEAAARVTEADFTAALARACGVITQVPPMYSALKHHGRPLHELAREGTEIDRAPREVTIHSLSLIGWAPPRARIAIDCTKGTYVRVLVHDLGRALGCGAHLTALRRTRSGRFTLADAMPLADLLRDPASARLVAPQDALALPSFTVAEADLRLVVDGRFPAGLNLPESLVQLVTPRGDLLALVEAGRFIRVFTYGLTKNPQSRKVPASSRNGRDVGQSSPSGND
jgi:tRNA pseudouridine55 synthase